MLFNVIVLSILEGITEFLPISSTGHLIILSEWLGMEKEFYMAFDISIQLGAILAVIFLYPSYFRNMVHPKRIFSNQNRALIAATVPILIIGYLFKTDIKELLFSSKVVFLGLIIGGIILILADLLSKQSRNFINKKDDVGFGKALIIGGFQCLALWPGMSRSAMTIIGGMSTGLNKVTAASFSFVIAVPTIVIVVGYELLSISMTFSLAQYGLIFIGMCISFIVAFFTMKWFLNIIDKQGLYLFGIYRIILGCLGFVFLL